MRSLAKRKVEETESSWRTEDKRKLEEEETIKRKGQKGGRQAREHVARGKSTEKQCVCVCVGGGGGEKGNTEN